MAFSNIGCITASPIFATQSWPSGVKTLGPVALPDKYRNGQIFIDLSQLTNLLAKLDVLVEMSMDGVIFAPVVGFSLDLPNSGLSMPTPPGVVDSSGASVRVSGVSLSFPQPISTVRQVRGTITLSVPAVIGMTLVIW